MGLASKILKTKSFSRRHSPYIIVSISGFVFTLFTIVIFFSSRYHTTHANLWVLGVALVTVGILAMIQTNQNMQSLSVGVSSPDPVPEGSMVFVLVRLKNHSSSIRYAFSIAFQKLRKNKQQTSSIGAKAESEIRLSMPCPKRGVFPLPAIFVWSFFPYGLCLAWKKISTGESSIVYPKPEGSPLHQHPRAGERFLAPHGVMGADDVTNLRRYQEGDSLSTIDWRLFAKRGTLFVRAREGGEGAEFELNWNHTNTEDDIEMRLKQLSKWCHDCLRQGIPFRLVLPGRPPLSHRNLKQCFEALARFSGESHT
jgi:uncharacterized protein (DUF58 family)